MNAAAEINTLTKACVGGLDLNDNQIGDANEKPSDTPNPSTEFKPLLNLGYYMELHYGYFKKDHVINGKKTDVWMVAERTRTGKADDIKTLQLKCQEDAKGFQPDHWKKCGLRDNQQCEDPKNPGVLRKGLSQCWMKGVKRAIPSLFKCVAFDSTTDKKLKEGYFHPDNYGLTNNYNRTICSYSKTWKNTDKTSTYKTDVQFSCSADDGKRKPDPSKKIVGWACLSFKSYTKPEEYLGSCIDESAHQICGKAGGTDKLTYLGTEHLSYGLGRAKKECGPKFGKGVCNTAEHVCSGGKWTACNNCKTCPQNTPGQKTICKGGVWNSVPTKSGNVNSCKVLLKPSPEKCNGLDDDCDGTIDEGLPLVAFYPDKDKDNYGDSKGTAIRKCAQQKPAGYVSNRSDCNDGDKAINPGIRDFCDGIDNNCNNRVDESAAFKNWYKDYDTDTWGENKVAFRACDKVGAAGVVCTGLNKCSKPTGHVARSGDCCDKDKNAFPRQGKYFPQANQCGSFDYNCDGKSSTDVYTCNCEKNVRYNWYSTTKHRFHGKDYNWLVSGSRSRPRTGYLRNTTTCELLGSISIEPTYDFKANFTCNWKESCGFLGFQTCSRSGKCAKSNARSRAKRTWTMAKPLGGGNYWAFPRSRYRKDCAYKRDGTTPKCGEQALKAPAIESFTYSKTFNESKTADAKFNCHKCSNIEFHAKLYYYIWFSEYYFTKAAVNNVTVQCH